jgi:hypothetical protein
MEQVIRNITNLRTYLEPRSFTERRAHSRPHTLIASPFGDWTDSRDYEGSAGKSVDPAGAELGFNE